MPEPPGPAPEEVYGTKEFYRWRAEDFKRRHPGKEPPPYYMDYGDKYARVFSDEVRARLSDMIHCADLLAQSSTSIL